MRASPPICSPIKAGLTRSGRTLNSDLPANGADLIVERERPAQRLLKRGSYRIATTF